MFNKKFIFLACVILLFITSISVISATDLNDDANTTANTISTDSTTHAMENVQNNEKENSYNSGLDTSNSATTNIGENDTSQNSETSTNTKDTTTEDATSTEDYVDNAVEKQSTVQSANTLDTRTIVKSTTTQSVKGATEITVYSWWDFVYSIKYSSTNDLIIHFVEGQTYTINTNYRFWDQNVRARNVTIIGHGAIIEGNGHRFLEIGGERTQGIYLTLNVTNLTFQNCGRKTGMHTGDMGGVIYGIHVPTLYVSNCTFINSTAGPGGAAILIHRGNLTVTDSTFINSNANTHGTIRVATDYANLTVDNVTFINSTTNGYGAAIYADTGGDVKITNTEFINCSVGGTSVSSGRGGAIYIQKAATVNLENNTFLNNSAVGEGTVYISSDSSSQVQTIINNTFINNTAYNGVGLNIKTSKNVIISNNTFENNVANNTSQGGAILIQKEVEAQLSGNIYKNNSAGSGGALYVESNAIVQLTDELFENNSATKGSAIYAEGNITSSNSSFYYNEADYGTVYITDSSSIFSGTDDTYENNTATSGGAIYVDVCVSTVFNNNSFNNNTATSGGAIYARDDVTITESSFNNNTATSGGAVYMVGSDLAIADSVFEYNSATSGGAICSDRAIDSSNNTFVNNSATRGGAIDLNSTLSLFDSDNDTFESNSATTGGVIYNYRGTITIDEAKINNNQASEGGFVYSSNSGTLTVTESQISNNNAGDGAVVYNHQGSTATFSQNNITDNTGINSVIYNSGTLTVDSNNVTHNIVTDNGGYVVSNENGTMTVTNNIFTNNTDYVRDMLLNSNNDKYTVSANTYDGNYLETHFTIDDIEIHNGEDVNSPITIYLRDIYNAKVLNGNLSAYVNGAGEAYADYPVDDGVATIIIQNSVLPNDSESDIKAVYSTKTTSYQSSETTFKVIPFTDTSISITCSAPDGKVVNKTITYIINLTDYSGKELKGKTVNVTVNGITTEYTTGENGLSDGIIVVPIVYDANGEKTIRVQYLGDEFYNHTTAELEHYVRKINTEIISTVPQGIAPGDEALINFTFKDEYGNTIPNKNITVRILKGSTELVATSVLVNATGNGNITFIPDEDVDYEVEILFRDENDSVHNYSINKSSLSVNKIPSETTLYDNFDMETLETDFDVILFDTSNSEPLPNKPITVYVTIKDEDGNSRTLAYPGAVTNGTGHYNFTVKRDKPSETVTVQISYDGDYRYVGTSFTKPFDGGLVMVMNITATNTYINKTNVISISVADKATGQPINGSFIVTREANDNEIIGI